MIFDRLKRIVDSEINDFLSQDKNNKRRSTTDDDIDFSKVDEEYDRMFNNKEKEQKATEDLKTNVYNNQARPHYATLGLPVGANMEQVKDQYKKLVKQHHPDRQTDPTKQKAALEMTQKLNIAYSFFKENPPKN